MPVVTQVTPCNFVGSFKVGDNLVFNVDLLCKLTETNADGAFNKPIVLQVGSILEAALSQIIFRAQHFNREGVPNMTEADRQEIEGKKIDKFSSVIDVMRKYHILDGLGLPIYDDLHKIRRYRNKIHIQDNIGIQGAPLDEEPLFSDAVRVWALDLNLRALTHLSNNFSRPRQLGAYVNPLVIPEGQ